MTNQEIKALTIEAANEDMAIAQESGVLFIAGTKIGNITIEADGDNFVAKDNQGAALTGPHMTVERFTEWLADKYVVEV